MTTALSGRGLMHGNDERKYNQILTPIVFWRMFTLGRFSNSRVRLAQSGLSPDLHFGKLSADRSSNRASGITTNPSTARQGIEFTFPAHLTLCDSRGLLVPVLLQLKLQESHSNPYLRQGAVIRGLQSWVAATNSRMGNVLVQSQKVAAVL
jgi:hypothetical protein